MQLVNLLTISVINFSWECHEQILPVLYIVLPYKYKIVYAVNLFNLVLCVMLVYVKH